MEKIRINLKKFLLLLLALVSTQCIQSREAPETGFTELCDNHPELTCFAIATAKSSPTVLIGGKATTSALSAFSVNPFLGIAVGLIAGGVATSHWLWAYDECIRRRNQRL